MQKPKPNETSLAILSEKLQIVILEAPYDTFRDKLTQDLFSKMVALKIDGYRAQYPYGVLPVDASDYVATHLLVCEITENQLTPILAQKSLALERADVHNLTFPLLNIAKSCGTRKHETAVKRILQRCRKSNIRLTYDSSVTFAPHMRQDPVLHSVVRDLIKVVHTLYHLETNTNEILSLASLRFKMEQVFDFLGYKPIQLNDETLVDFSVPSYFNEKVRMIHLTEGFSSLALALAKKYKHLWDKRILVSNPTKLSALVQKKAA